MRTSGEEITITALIWDNSNLSSVNESAVFHLRYLSGSRNAKHYAATIEYPYDKYLRWYSLIILHRYQYCFKLEKIVIHNDSIQYIQQITLYDLKRWNWMNSNYFSSTLDASDKSKTRFTFIPVISNLLSTVIDRLVASWLNRSFLQLWFLIFTLIISDDVKGDKW